jgi:hypothetical protein
MSDRGATLSREHLFGEPLETLLPAGLAMRVGLEDELSSMTNRPGDEFSAWVEDPLTIGGIPLLTSAAEVRGTVTEVEEWTSLDDPGRVAFEFTAIADQGIVYPIHATLIAIHPEGRYRSSLPDPAENARSAEGAVAGSQMGRFMAGNEAGAAIGALAGAAVGAAFRIGGTPHDYAVLPAGSEMVLRLDQPVRTLR